MKIDGRFMTKSHPGYNSDTPKREIGARSREITYIKKGLHATQVYPTGLEQTADYFFVAASNITFINIFFPGPSGSLEPLLQGRPNEPTVIGDDFNSVHRY